MKAQEKSFSRFLVVWSGQFVSAIGNGLTAFALGVYVFNRTQSAMGYTLIILFTFLPVFILLPFGGVLADRFDRKKMMIIGDAGAVLGLVYILVTMLAGEIRLWQIYAGVALSSVFTAIQGPAYKAAVSDLVSEAFYSRAGGLIQLAGSAQYLISPLVAGFLMSVFDIELVLVIDIMTFLAAVAAVFMIGNRDAAPPRQEAPGRNFFHDMADSMRYIHSKKGIMLLVVLTALVSFYIGLLQSLFGPMMLTLTDSRTLGIALSVSASGMLVSSLYIGLLGLKKRKVFILSLSLALAGFAYALMGFFTAVVLIMVSGFFFFITLPFVNTCLEVLIRTNVDNEKQGRTWSLVSAISQGGYILAYGTAGFLADSLFIPLLSAGGALSDSVGRIMGTGPGRGIGFLFVLCGLAISAMAFVFVRVKRIRALEPGDARKDKAQSGGS